jgi:hypothetical protein
MRYITGVVPNGYRECSSSAGSHPAPNMLSKTSVVLVGRRQLDLIDVIRKSNPIPLVDSIFLTSVQTPPTPLPPSPTASRTRSLGRTALDSSFHSLVRPVAVVSMESCLVFRIILLTCVSHIGWFYYISSNINLFLILALSQLSLCLSGRS